MEAFIEAIPRTRKVVFAPGCEEVPATTLMPGIFDSIICPTDTTGNASSFSVVRTEADPV